MLVTVSLLMVNFYQMLSILVMDGTLHFRRHRAAAANLLDKAKL